MKTSLFTLPVVLLLATSLVAQETSATTPAPIVRRSPEPEVSPALLNPPPITLSLGQAAAQMPASSPSALPPAPLPAPPPCYQPYPCCYPRLRPAPPNFDGPLAASAIIAIVLVLIAFRGA